MVRPPTGSVSGNGQLGEGEKLKFLQVISRGIYFEKFICSLGGGADDGSLETLPGPRMFVKVSGIAFSLTLG